MTRAEIRQFEKQKKFQLNETIKRNLALKIGLNELYAGGHTIRNDKGWRDNEITIDYIWIAKMSLSFVVWAGLITIKYNKTEFRGINNPEKLTQGIFLYNANGEITELYIENKIDDIDDPIWKINNLEMFDANKGITLDGVSYEYNVIAKNIETQISANNPNSTGWKNWEKEIWNLGHSLAKNSENKEMRELFK